MLEYPIDIKIQLEMKKTYMFLGCFIMFFSFYSCNNINTSYSPFKSIDNENIDGKQLLDTLESPKENVVLNRKDEQQEIDTLKCNILIIKQTEEKLGMLKYSDISLFLSTFSKDCSNNIEYSEYSNRILYKVLEFYPAELIEYLDSLNEIDIDYIISVLSDPLLDINGKKLIEIINKAHGETGIKDRLIRAIKKAMD